MEPFVALTDRRWFEFLWSRSTDGRVDEVNFWSPATTKVLKRMAPGEPMFLRFGAPFHAVVGYGFFLHHAVLSLDAAWRAFAWKNGCGYFAELLQMIGGYRRLDLLDPRTPQAPLGCTILREVRLWARDRWLPWGAEVGWPKQATRGASVREPALVQRLLAQLDDAAARATVGAEVAPVFEPVEVDERTRVAAERVVREGQGTFRTRLLDAYGGQCAVTGEHTEPVLDAAHIQPYLGPRSNHPQNGLLLTKEFHALFDLGLVAVTDDYRVRVSPALRDRWNNGHRYYAYHDRPLVRVPSDAAARPSRRALAWHRQRHRFAG